MQQTEKYKLNLIESSDPFSPAALNGNTQKLEDAMSAHEEEVAGQVAGLDARIAVFEAKKFAYGLFQGSGNSTPVHVDLPFKPKIVFAVAVSSNGSLSLISLDLPGGYCNTLPLDDTGFSMVNYTFGTFFYAAVG